MRGLQSQFGLPLVLALIVGLASLLVAGVLVGRHRSTRPAWLVLAARALAVGAVVATFIATAFPNSMRFETDGDLVLRIGGAGLGDLDQLMADPTSLAAILLFANVLLYSLISFFGSIGWQHRPGRVLLGALALSLLVETIQLVALGRVASVDDVILNFGGALIGYLAAALLLSRSSRVSELVAGSSGSERLR